MRGKIKEWEGGEMENERNSKRGQKERKKGIKQKGKDKARLRKGENKKSQKMGLVISCCHYY